MYILFFTSINLLPIHSPRCFSIGSRHAWAACDQIEKIYSWDVQNGWSVVKLNREKISSDRDEKKSNLKYFLTKW
jgi:hypothetical protein